MGLPRSLNALTAILPVTQPQPLWYRSETIKAQAMRAPPTLAIIVACLWAAGCVPPAPPRPQSIDATLACPTATTAELLNVAACLRTVDAINEDREERWERAMRQRAAAISALLGVADDTAAAPRPPIFAAAPPELSPAPAPAPPIPTEPPPFGTSPPVHTWGETPYAPMIPPVMRDQPVTVVNPMVPPAAREMQ